MKPLSAFDIIEMPALEAIGAIRSGLPAAAFDEVAKVLLLTSKELADKLRERRATPRRPLVIARRLSARTSERLVQIAHLHRAARHVFTTNRAVALWMASPAPALGNAAPMDLLDTEIGIQEVETVLMGMAFGTVM